MDFLGELQDFYLAVNLADCQIAISAKLVALKFGDAGVDFTDSVVVCFILHISIIVYRCDKSGQFEKLF